MPVRDLVLTGRFDHDQAAQAAGWLRLLNGEEEAHHHHHPPHGQHDHSHHHHHSSSEGEAQEAGGVSRHGLWSVVYRARRPFHPDRLWAFVHEDMGAVLRSKGFFWLASRHDETGVWSQAGGSFVQESGGAWWAATEEEDWPEEEEEREEIKAEFEGEGGDRRQELVFIGHGQPLDTLTSRLDGCLLTDEEMRVGPKAWRRLKDPFPAWAG